MNDNPDFKFRYNGVTYSVTFANLDTVLRNFNDQINDDILETAKEFPEATEVIKKIKSKL